MELQDIDLTLDTSLINFDQISDELMAWAKQLDDDWNQLIHDMAQDQRL